jgi:sugar phosphate isomerase/epimerase
MPDRPNLPRIGAALPIAALAHHRDWLIEGQRDLELQDFFQVDLLNGDWSDRVAEAKRQLDGYGGRLGIHGPFWGFALDSHDPDVRALVARRLDRGLDACAAVGATQMVVHSPYRTWDFNNLDNHADGRSAIVERTHQTLKAAVKRAEAQGVTIVLENIEDKDPRDRVALARSFGSPAVKVSLDTGHAHYAHVSTGAPPVDYYVVAAGDLLDHVHVQDSDGHADRHWAPGEGTIRWHAVFGALARLSVRPRLVLELRHHEQVPQGAAHLGGLGLVS